MSIKKSLQFLQEQYGLNFSFQTFNKDVSGTFYGPMNAYSYYNESGCFTVYHAVQRNEWEYFVADKYSQNQAELLLKYISPQIFDEVRKRSRTIKNFFKSEVAMVADIIKEQISTNGEFYGIKIIR